MPRFAVASAALLAAASVEWTPREGASLIGTRAPELRGIRWVQGGPLTLAGLRGRAVLIRFWLVDCPYCERTAPALRELQGEYGGRGLAVIGLHHPKSDEARDPVVVQSAARGLGLTFPVGIDDNWETARAFGVGTVFTRFTSVSILVDRRGTIRFVHDGGEFHRGGGLDHRECNAAYQALRTAIEGSLSDASPPGPGR